MASVPVVLLPYAATCYNPTRGSRTVVISVGMEAE